MGNLRISKEQMLKRVARFKDLVPSEHAFVDSKIPGHERLIFNVIGNGVTEDATLRPAIPEAKDFNVTYIKAEPGKGAALHSHLTVEVFIPLSGKWAVYWGDQGENELVLDPWDTISLPPGVMRGFRNAGTEDAYLLAVLGGTDPGRVTWQPEVLQKSKGTGLRFDEQGNVIQQA